MQVEEEFIKILPPQRTNVAKYLDEEQLAMQAAVSSRSLDVMEAEMKTPSVQFKRLAIREIVRLEKDDDKLLDYVVNSVPAFRKKFIHYLIDARKTSVLERAFPVLEKEHGSDVVAAFVHGCSTEFLTEQLKRREIRVCKTIKWSKIARYDDEIFCCVVKLTCVVPNSRYNGRVILEMIRNKLAANISAGDASHDKLNKIWDRWYRRLSAKVVLNELLRNGGNSGVVLDIAVKSPIFIYLGDKKPIPKLSECPKELVAFDLPIFIRDNLPHFVVRHTEEMLEFLKRTIYLVKDAKTQAIYLT
jgi:hypothetical protein